MGVWARVVVLVCSLVAVVVVEVYAGSGDCEELAGRGSVVYAVAEGGQVDAGQKIDTHQTPLSLSTALVVARQCGRESNVVTIRLAVGLYLLDFPIEMPPWTAIEGGFVQAG